jgi:hypothetical protein
MINLRMKKEMPYFFIFFNFYAQASLYNNSLNKSFFAYFLSSELNHTIRYKMIQIDVLHYQGRNI